MDVPLADNDEREHRLVARVSLQVIKDVYSQWPQQRRVHIHPSRIRRTLDRLNLIDFDLRVLALRYAIPVDQYVLRELVLVLLVLQDSRLAS